MKPTLRIPALLLVGMLIPALSVFSRVATVERGEWPDTWPEELEPYRDQAKTVQVGHGIQERVYEIRFNSREDFERAWPHILTVKSKGAPLVIERGPFTYNVSGSEVVSGVMVLSPSLGYSGGPSSPPHETWNQIEELVTQGRILRAGPPWPEYLYSEDGQLPEYVKLQEKDGRLTWIPADAGPRFRHRARVDIVLVVDGEVIDLNRVPLPPDTPIVDRRFSDSKSGI